MSNPMKYIKDLEAAGFERNQAEAQVQMVLDVLEGDLVTKSDLTLLKEQMDNRFNQIDYRFNQIDNRFIQSEERVDNRFMQSEERVNDRFMQCEERFDNKIKESEFRVVTRLGVLMVSCMSITVALLTWLIKV